MLLLFVRNVLFDTPNSIQGCASLFVISSVKSDDGCLSLNDMTAHSPELYKMPMVRMIIRSDELPNVRV